MANNFIQQVGRNALERASKMVPRFNDWDRGGLYGGVFRNLLSGTTWDYEKSAGGKRFYENSAVFACISLMANTFTEAPPIIQKRDTTGRWVPDYKHRLLDVLNQPNEFFDWRLLAQACVTDLYIDGNTYLYKVRNDFDMVTQVWWIPHWMVEPVYEGGLWLSHYEYNPYGIRNEQNLGNIVRWKREDVVHLRLGYDPDNPRKGRTPLKAALREIATDNEATIFAASVVRNMGIPGMIIAPDGGEDAYLDEDQRKLIKDMVKQQTTGDNRGDAIVLSMPIKITNPAFSPDKLALDIIRRVPEERIAAVMHIPAVTAGLGAGLQAASAKASHAESREAFYEQAVKPLQINLAAQLSRQLLSEVSNAGVKVGQYRIWYDYSDVSAMQGDFDRKAERIGKLYERGVMYRDDALSELGYPFDPKKDHLVKDEVPMRTQVIATDAADPSQDKPMPDKAKKPEEK